MTNVATLVVFALATGVAMADAGDLLTFEKFPAKESAVATPASVRLSSHRDAPTFRTVLRDGAKVGPNFAGHFTIVTWGCGTACQRLAIVDALSGNVFFPPQLQPNAYHMVTDGSVPFQYRRDSELLIVTGAPRDREDEGVYYYRWSGESLTQLRYVPKTWQR